jgi:hypothetical protein
MEEVAAELGKTVKMVLMFLRMAAKACCLTFLVKVFIILEEVAAAFFILPVLKEVWEVVDVGDRR